MSSPFSGRAWGVVAVVLLAAGGVGCSSGSAAGQDAGGLEDAGTPADAARPADAGSGGTVDGGQGGAGHVTYMLGGTPWIIEAREGAAPVDLAEALDALSPRGTPGASTESGVALSEDGAWLGLRTERFDPECAGWACFALVARDLSRGEVLRTPSGLVHPEDLAVASGGALVVYGEDWKLWATSRGAGGWSAPVELTAGSPYAFHWRPALGRDARRVLMDCGDETFPAAALCEVGVDGTGFRTVVTRGGGPGGTSGPGVHHAAAAPDGSVVFEGEFAATEQIWRLPAAGGPPSVVAASFTNDNSPCVLPDGRIASLWLNRPNSAGDHELKVMAADGSAHVMLVTGADIADVGLSCGH